MSSTTDQPPSSWHAWIDESMRMTDDEHGTYLLAAVVCDTSGCTHVRQDLCGLLLGRQRRLHWRDEDERRRDRITDVVSKVDMDAVVVVGVPLRKAKQERGRRLCMEVLLPHLAGLGVNQVWLENRTPSLNKADMKMVLALRSKRAIPKDLRVDVAKPEDEPMLWLPDVVAGAVGAARHGGEPRWLASMQHVVTELPLELH